MGWVNKREERRSGQGNAGECSPQRPGSREIFQGSWEKSLNRWDGSVKNHECPAEEVGSMLYQVKNSDAVMS